MFVNEELVAQTLAAGSESADVLAVGLLALAILSVFLGVANVYSVVRFRLSTFPAIVRPRAKKPLWALAVVTAVNLVAVPAIGFWGYKLSPTVDLTGGDEWLRAGLLTVALVLLLGTNYAGMSISRTLMRLKLQREGEAMRRGAGMHLLIRTLRENLIAGVVLLGISVLIWYLIDKQLSDAVQVEVPIRVNLLDQLGETWTVTKQPGPVSVIFQGPKDRVQGISPARIVGVVTLRKADVTNDSEEITRPILLSEITFESNGEPIPSEIMPTAGAENLALSVTLNQNHKERVVITDTMVLPALTDKPADWKLQIKQTDPAEVWIVYPKTKAAGSSPVKLQFQELSIAPLADANKQNRDFRRDLEIRREPEQVRVFRDEALREPINKVQVTFEFVYTKFASVTFSDVPIRVNEPSSFIERSVSIEQLPTLAPKFDNVRVSGPANAIEGLRAGNLCITIWVNESAIDWDKLEKERSFQITGNKYILTTRDGEPLPAGIQLVEPNPNTRFGLQLIKVSR